MESIGGFGAWFRQPDAAAGPGGLAGAASASRRLDDLAREVSANSDAILRSLHPPSPGQDGPAGAEGGLGAGAAASGGGAGAVGAAGIASGAWLATDEGRAALQQTLERGWSFLRGLVGGAVDIAAAVPEQLPLPLVP